MVLTQYPTPAFLQWHSFNREKNMLPHFIISLSLGPESHQAIIFLQSFFSLWQLCHPVTFLLKPPTLLLLTRPYLRDLILISQITLKGTCAAFYTTANHLPDSSPSIPDILPTLTFLSSLNPVFLTAYLLRDIHLLTMFTSLSYIFNFPFPEDKCHLCVWLCHSFSQKIKVLSCPYTYLLEKLTRQTEFPESKFSPSTLS